MGEAMTMWPGDYDVVAEAAYGCAGSGVRGGGWPEVGCWMTSRPRGVAPLSEPERQQAVRHADVALRSMGQPNSVASQFDFWNDRYEGRRLFSELLGTFFLVLVAVGGGMVSARFGGSAVPY